MAAQYHSKICAHAHNAMEELFGAGLLDPQSMYHFDVLCRADTKSQAQSPSHPPLAPWLAELRAQVVLPDIPYVQAPPAPQPKRTARVKAPTASASYATVASASATPRKETRAQSRPAAEQHIRPRAPSPVAQPASPRHALPKTDEWQFSEDMRSTQSAALAATARAAPAGTFKQTPSRQKSAAELRQLREREGVSEAVFARCLGVPPQTVIAWESGTVLPSPRVSRMLATIEEKGLNAVG